MVNTLTGTPASSNSYSRELKWTREFPASVFVSGIGTDVGKSWATGWLARTLMQAGESVITQKFVQTGNVGMSEDIEVHRKIMGLPYQPCDLDHTTAPIILSYPASPHLAAEIDNVEVDWEIPARSMQALSKDFDHVLIEGAGGLMVPLSHSILTIDWVKDHSLPLVLVTSGKLGSISDTLLALFAAKKYEIPVCAMVYNPYFDSDETIAKETRLYLRDFLKNYFPDSLWIEMPREVLKH